jgi:hypothetical protein
MDITGTIKEISEEQVISEKFKKRDFVITDNSSQYPQHISFQVAQDRCALLDKYKVGDEIKVHFNLRGREWTSPKGELRHFNTLEAWRFEAGEAAPEAQTEVAPRPSDDSDDLPF